MKLLAILVLVLGLATVATASGNSNSNDCPGNSCHAQGGAGGAGGDATATGGDATATGGDATAISGGGDADARATSVSGSSSQAAAISGAVAGSSSGSAALSNDSIQIDDHSSYSEVSDAPAMQGASAPVDNICGNVTGVSAGVGIGGGGISKPSFTCHVHKHLLFQERHAGQPSAYLESIAFWLFAIPQAAFSVVF